MKKTQVFSSSTCSFSIQQGMEDGQRITFSGEGDQEPGLEPGDIVIELDEKGHEVKSL